MSIDVDDEDTSRRMLSDRADAVRSRLADTIAALDVRRHELVHAGASLKSKLIGLALLGGVGSLALGGAIVYAAEQWQWRAERKINAKFGSIRGLLTPGPVVEVRKPLFVRVVERTLMAVVPFALSRLAMHLLTPRKDARASATR